MKSINLQFIHKLKRKWKLESSLQVVLILCVFALSGTTVVWLKSIIFDYLGVNNSTSILSKIGLYIIIVLPLYQLLLIGYGFLLGQQKFFLNKVKRLQLAFKK